MCVGLKSEASERIVREVWFDLYKETVYQNAFGNKLEDKGLSVKREVRIPGLNKIGSNFGKPGGVEIIGRRKFRRISVLLLWKINLHINY